MVASCARGSLGQDSVLGSGVESPHAYSDGERAAQHRKLLSSTEIEAKDPEPARWLSGKRHLPPR